MSIADNQMSPLELHALRDGGKPLQLVDVREDFERDIATISNDIHIPMNDMKERMSDLDPEKTTVIYCRSGNRSLMIVEYLRSMGFKNVKNLDGGINRWADEVDQQITKY